MKQLQDHMKSNHYGVLASVIGRYYAMDRDKRWERIQIAYEGLVQGTGEKCTEDEIISVCVI